MGALVKTFILVVIITALFSHPGLTFDSEGKKVFHPGHGGRLPNGGKIWAVLVAASKGWQNYRHQSNICRIYQILHAHGIPDEQIVVMMTDDIAYNKENSFPGKIFNEYAGPNVYEGVPKDYTGENVTSTNFLNALSGKKKLVNSKKVIESGPKDHIFVAIVDHGAPGFVCFPNIVRGRYDKLFATQLRDVVTDMKSKQKFDKMLIFIESCESGSMFDWLSPDLNVLGLSSTTSTRSSYACCVYNTIISSVFTNYWTQYAESHQAYFNQVRFRVGTMFDFLRRAILHQESSPFSGANQQAQTYGGSGYVEYEPLSYFMGFNNVAGKNKTFTKCCQKSLVNERDATRYILELGVKQAKSLEERNRKQENLDNYIRSRSKVDATFESLFKNSILNMEKSRRSKQTKNAFKPGDCYREMMDILETVCWFDHRHKEDIFGHYHKLIRLCNKGVSPKQFEEACLKECSDANYL